MILEFANPLPVVVGKEDGYAIYVRDGGTFENDIWAVVLCNGGRIIHVRSDQLVVHVNSTFDIQKFNDDKRPKQRDNTGRKRKNKGKNL